MYFVHNIAYNSQGGDVAYEHDQYLQATYNLTDKDIVTIAQSAQTFFKYYVAIEPQSFENEYGHPYPLNCSSNPWQDYTLSTDAAPGEEGGPTCQCDNYYYYNTTTINYLMGYFFDEVNYSP
jgi:hypothetical protein